MEEAERKFLLNFFPDIKQGKTINIKQAYLFNGIDINGDKCHLRLRVTDNKIAELTYKVNRKDKKYRDEFNSSLDIKEGLELLENNPIQIHKIRYTGIFENLENYDVIIDSYPLFKIIVVEIETHDNLKYPIENIKIPTFCGKEVTDDKNYSNIHLAFKAYELKKQTK